MKHKLRFLNFLFCPRGQIIIALLFCNSVIVAQEQTPPVGEFPIGSTFGSGNRTTQALYESYAETGMNMIEQYAADSTRPFLGSYNLCAMNMDRMEDYIYHYSSSYYSKWQAEVDQDTPYVGVKHKFGQQAYLGDTLCWSSIGMTSPGDSLLFGPHYHQEKWYRRWLYNDPNMNGIYDVRYIPRYRMALDITDTTIGLNEDVCRIYVMVRHGREINGVGDIVRDDTLKAPKTLKVSDFPANGQFDYFYFSDNPDERWYRYPEEYQTPVDYYNRQHHTEEGTVWVDIHGNNGVEFRVEWLRSDAKCTLYVDYVEVYDDFGWRQFIELPGPTANDIKTYALNFKNEGWSNIKNWIGCDEPFTIDAYIPLRTVDSLLRDIGAPPLLVHFYPYWDVKINADSQLVRYYKTAKPDPLNIHFFPFLSWFPTARYEDWEAFRNQLQISYTLTKEKGFWYKAQNFGTQLPSGEWSVWRQPDSSEHKAEIMLALAHGVKGLTFSHYDSYPQEGYILQGFIKDDPPTYTKTALWYLVKDNIVPRLKGKLGKTLMDLDYSGVYLELRRYMGPNTGESVTENYLTLSTTPQNPTPFTYYFHAGFFEKLYQPDNHHFFLTNLITNGNRYVNVKVINDCSVFLNTRFRNIEPEANFDTTFTCEFSNDMLFPPGEGYLYQVAPVIKYGGKLIYPETISSATTLQDEMVIQNGAILTVNSTYNVYADITVKTGGRIITTGNGKINFYQGHKLIIEGAATIAGTASNKLKLDFLTPENSNGIIIKPGASLAISYCEIKNAVKGITSELNYTTSTFRM